MKGPITRLSLASLALLGFTGVFSPASSAESNSIGGQAPPAERQLVIENFLHEKLVLWQRRLRLEDWKVTVKLAHRADLKPKTLGNVHWDTTERTASIRVMHPDDYTMPLSGMLEDMEVTVVHELVHLHLASLPRSDSTKGAEEQAVKFLSEALIGLDRRK